MERKSETERRREREKKLSTFVWASRRTSLHPKKTRAIAGPTAEHLMGLFSVPKLKTGHQLALSVTVQIKASESNTLSDHIHQDSRWTSDAHLCCCACCLTSLPSVQHHKTHLERREKNMRGFRNLLSFFQKLSMPLENVLMFLRNLICFS